MFSDDGAMADAQEFGDIIKYYNRVFLPVMKPFMLQVTCIQRGTSVF